MVENKKRKDKSLLISIILLIIILGSTGAFILLMMANTRKENEIIVTDATLKVEGQYGKIFQFSDFVSISLSDTMPKILRKVNGAGLRELKKGIFELENLGNCHLYVHNIEGPFIIIKTQDINPIIINLYEVEDTEKLYDKLRLAYDEYKTS